MARGIEHRIEDAFRRIVRSRSENGRGKTSEKILADGITFFREHFLGENGSEVFNPRDLAKYLTFVDAVKSEEEGLALVQSIPHMYQIDDGKMGHLYFERHEKKIIVGYSHYN